MTGTLFKNYKENGYCVLKPCSQDIQTITDQKHNTLKSERHGRKERVNRHKAAMT